MSKAEKAEYIRDARAEYDAYGGEEWTKAGFDEHSGGYWVYHKEHRFDPTIGIFGISRSDYERISSEVLMNYSMRIVLDSEKPLKNADKKKDGFLNGIPFDIKGIDRKSVV